MKVTVCELPHEPGDLEHAWAGLCAHTQPAGSQLVLLPEVAFSGPLWLSEQFDPEEWRTAVAAHEAWIARLGELGVPWVVGTRPVTADGQRFNQGFLWGPTRGLVPLRRKYFLPDEPGSWEARWFARGDPAFPAYRAGELSFGLNVCTELWALETYRGYTEAGVSAVLAPRATAASTTDKWLAAGTVAAVASGAYGVSSNRVHRDGSCGGVGWVIDPDGELLARTSRDRPWCTVELDLGRAQGARATYPRYVLGRDAGGRSA